MTVADWYDYPTNYSNGTIADTPGKLFLKYPGMILNDWLGISLVGIIWVFIFIVSMGSGSSKALLTSSFITFIFAIMFVRLGMINPIVILILIILIIVGVLMERNELGY